MPTLRPDLNGRLLQNDPPDIYLVDGGKARYVNEYALSIFEREYENGEIKPLPLWKEDDIKSITPGDPLEGLLGVIAEEQGERGAPAKVYLIDRKQKRWIPGESISGQYRLDFRYLRRAPRYILELIADGPDLEGRENP